MNLKDKKSSGIAAIGTEHVKQNRAGMCEPHIFLIIKIIEDEKSPTALKIGQIKPLFEGEKNYVFLNKRPPD